MPLLPKEPDLAPDDLFSLPLDRHPWGVAHVRSRQEKVLARHFVQHGIPFYLPISSERRERHDRVRTAHVPLFPGYVFHRAPHESRELVRRSNVIANLIDVPDQRQLAEELAQLRRLQESGLSLRPYVQLVPGEPVRVTEGVFAGYTGVIVREASRDRLLVRVTLLRQAVSVEFDRDVVERTRR